MYKGKIFCSKTKAPKSLDLKDIFLIKHNQFGLDELYI